MLSRIVWPAVIAAVLPVVSVISAILGNGEVAVATGLGAISFAILSNREGR